MLTAEPDSAEQQGRGGARPEVPGVDQIDALTHQSMRWFIITALACRAGFTVPAIVLNQGVLGELGGRILPLSVAVLVLDAVLIVAAIRRPGLLVTRWLFAADMVVTAAATIVATLLIPPGTFLVPGMDAMTGYGWGTVALWTAIRGFRTGCVLVVSTAAAQVSMAALNGDPLDGDGVAQVVLRVGFAVMNFLVAAAIAEFARRGAVLAVSEGLRAGRLAERAEVLRQLHDTSLAELDAIVLMASRERIPAARRLELAVRRARTEAARLRRTGPSAGDADDVLSRLAELVDSFRGRGLLVDLDSSPPMASTGPQALDALVGAVREALNNVVKHAGVGDAGVRVRSSAGAIEVEVADRGRGFRPDRGTAGFGLLRSIHERIADVGGQVQVSSAPGAGCRVTLTVPGSGELGTGEVERAAAAAVTWFPLVPLVARILALPLIGFMLIPFLTEHLVVLFAVVLGLLVGNVVLFAALLRPGAERLLRSRLLLAVDLTAVAGCYLLTVSLQPAGVALQPGGDGLWLYIIVTVPFWLAIRGPVTGLVLLIGSTGMVALAAILNDIAFRPVDGLLFAQHLVLVGAATAFAALVMRQARRGMRAALDESTRAGRASERVDALVGLHRRVLATWDAIAAPAPGIDAEARLATVGSIAGGMSRELRAVLSAQRPAAPTSTLPDALAALARSSKVSVELVVAELTGDPPPAVAAAVVAAVEASLAGLDGASLVVRVSGTADRVEVVVRDPLPRPGPDPAAVSIMAAVGGEVDIRSHPERGTRTRLIWRAP